MQDRAELSWVLCITRYNFLHHHYYQAFLSVRRGRSIHSPDNRNEANGILTNLGARPTDFTKLRGYFFADTSPAYFSDGLNGVTSPDNTQTLDETLKVDPAECM